MRPKRRSAALTLWLRLQPSSGGGLFDVVDARAFLLFPIYLLIAVGLGLAVAHVVVRRGSILALAGAVAVFVCALAIIWPSSAAPPPWPWTIISYDEAPE